MVRHGEAPFLECSSRGDQRFSAFSARLRSHGGRSIEEVYQAAKVFEDGSTGLGWRDAKGKRAVNMPEVRRLYSRLWHSRCHKHHFRPTEGHSNKSCNFRLRRSFC